MPLSCSDGNGLTFPDEKILKIVEKYIETGLIPLKELDDEKMLTLDFFKLAVPLESINGSLAWKHRNFGSEMEIPYIVRFYFKNNRNWRGAILEYFKAIGEQDPEEFVRIFGEVVEKATGLLICCEDLIDIAMKHGKEPGALISELKGSGLISPIVGCGVFGKSKAPLYEINRFFAILLKIEE